MKFYSPVIRFLESVFGVEDNDKDGKVQVRFLFWAVVASLFTWKLMVYWSLHNGKINGSRFFKEPGFGRLTDSVLNFIADRIGMEVIKNLNIIKFIENFDLFWSILIIIVICFIINRHALSQYNRDKGKNIHYYALLAHMFMFYISLLKFQWCGLLYFVAIFLTSLVWYIYYSRRLQDISWQEILKEYSIVYSAVIFIFSIGLAPMMVFLALLYMASKLWGPSPNIQ